MMNKIDIDIENYTIGELIKVFDLEEPFTEDDIDKKIDELMVEYQGETQIIYFLSTARYVLKDYLIEEIQEEDEEIYDDETEEEYSRVNIPSPMTRTISYLPYEEQEDTEKEDTEEETEDEEEEYEEEIIEKELQAKNEFDNETDQYIKSYLQDVSYGDKIVNRKEGVDIVNEDKYVMSQTRLPIQQEYTVPVVRGQINPNLKNIQSCILNIDSQFREDIDSPSTDFTFDLSDPLNNTLSLSLINAEIPHSWYVIDVAYGTDSFEIVKTDISDNTIDKYLIELENGNYTPSELIIEIETKLDTVFLGSSPIKFEYNPKTNKIQITNIDTDTNHIYTIIFYNTTLSQNESNRKINYNLGWICGFREFMYELTASTSIKSEGLVDLYGPKYILIGLDEFKANNVNKGIVTITDYDVQLSYPSYYTPDISLDDPNFRFENGGWVPSGLKETQVYTINQIYQEKLKNKENRYSGNSSSKIIARIPVEKRTNYSMIFNANSHLKYNIRSYYGPVDITRMRITIYSDKGQIMNFNGQDYSLAFLVEQLYQY